MKLLIIGLLLSTTLQAQIVGVKGAVSQTSGCSQKAMVWLSLDKNDYHERLLLMHTLVPVRGTYQFYLKPGKYQVRGSDEAGCEFFSRIEVKNSVVNLDVKMVKK